MKRSYWLIPPLIALVSAIVWSEPGAKRLWAQAKPAPAEEDWQSKKIVPFVPSDEQVVDKMLELAEVKKGDVVYDLGSGDGRIVIAAAKKYGVRAVGFEIDPKLIKESRERIKKEKLEKLAEIRQQDILTVDLSPASVITMYLLPGVNMKLRPKIQSQLKPGARVVSHDFDMGDWKPDETVNVGNYATVYLWRIGGKKT